MRGVGLTLVTCAALGCSPPPDASPPPEPAGDAIAAAERPRPTEPRTDVDDPLLARARGRVRDGRVPDALRSELLDSQHPDHRHAARLLQAIAGEKPAAVLARTGSRPAVALAEPPKPEPPKPELERPPTPTPEPAGAPAQPDEPDEPDEPDAPIMAAPKLSELPVGSSAWSWYATGIVERDQAGTIPAAAIALDPLAEPLPVLLSERPPAPEPTPARRDDAPRLVILTSLELRPGPTPDRASLELAGAGSVELGAQPLPGNRLRLWMLDAGAVPAFLAARPSAPGLAVVDVARRDRWLEIEVELGHGWALLGASALANGASAAFGRISVEPAAGRDAEPM